MERVTISAKAMEEDQSLWFPISADEMKIGQGTRKFESIVKIDIFLKISSGKCGEVQFHSVKEI